MSLSLTTSRNDYTGNGATSVYAYSFKIFDETDLVVTKRLISTGVETTLALTTDYTVSGVGETAGGSITLVAGSLASTYDLTIRRVLPLVQELDIRNQGDYFPENTEDALDKATMIDQQQQDEIDRSLKLPETVASAGFDPTLPASIADTAGACFIVNAAKDGLEMGPVLSAIADSFLAVSYIKADGTRALTGNWSAGAFSATFNSVIVGSAANTISGLATIINGAGTLTLPTSTDTIVGRATTDTLTNKTISGGSNTISAIADGSLSTSYIKADGTRALTGNWSAGAFYASFNSLDVGKSTGTGICLDGSSSDVDIVHLGSICAEFGNTRILSNAQHRVISGSLATPSIVDASHTTTGIYFGAVNTIDFCTAGVNALTISASQNATFAGTVTSNSVIIGSAANRISGLATIINGAGTLTLPTATTTIVGHNTTDVLTNKTLTGNTAANLISGSGTLTLNTSGTITVPNGTDTLVGKATSDVLTNKTLTSPLISAINAAGTSVLTVNGGLTVTATSGTGNVTVNSTNTDAYFRWQANGTDKWYAQNEGSAANDLQFLNASAVKVLSLTQLKNVVVGSAALATNATDGFLYLTTTAGTPSGVPSSFSGRSAILYDTTANKLWVYNGAWKFVTLS